LTSIDTTLELTQVTPVHGVVHTELTGNPPMHRHPVTSVLVPRFVDATKSHIARSDEDTVGLTVGEDVGDRVGTQLTPTDKLHELIAMIVNMIPFIKVFLRLYFRAVTEYCRKDIRVRNINKKITAAY
jgi:hypothetical protein